MTTNNIVGQDEILNYIEKIVETGNVPSGVIFNGDKGAGKKLLAKTFAMALNCTGDGSKPCRSCKSCIQAENNTQPDIIWVIPSKIDANLSIDDLKAQVLSTVSVAPVNSKYKIYIIPNADMLNETCQNAILKTLEEPPANVVFFLLTKDYKKMLPTILSRCMVLRIRDITDSLIEKYLIDNMEIPKEKAILCTAFARGNLGRAIKMANSEYFIELKNKAVNLLENIGNLENYEIVDAINNMAKSSKMEITDILDYMTIWYRDILMFKATNDIDKVIFKDKIDIIKQRAVSMSYEGIEEVLDALDNAKKRLDANVKFDLVMELLLLTMKEN